MRKLLLASLGLVLVASMTGAQANHSWNNYHWARTSNPFGVNLVDSVIGPWDSLLGAVAADWGASSVLNTSVSAGNTKIFARQTCNAFPKQIHVCSANYGPNLWFGQATVYLSNGHISKAITQLNDFYFTGSYNNQVARRHVLCQEIGHNFGLDHQHGVPTCMEDNNATLNNTGYQFPNAHDYSELSTIYAHLDNFTSSSSFAASPLRAPDRVQVIGGETVLTFIYWANR